MRCPKCGAEGQGKPNFCSTCGFELQESADEQSAPEVAPSEVKGWQNPMTFGFRMIALGMVIALFGEKIFLVETFSSVGTVIAFIGAGLIGLRGVFVAVCQSKELLWSKAPMRSERTKLAPHAGKHPDKGPEGSGETSRDDHPTS
jgi:hypothetical protein